MKKRGIKLLNMRVYWQYAIMYLIIVGIVILVLTPIYNVVLSISKRVYLQEVNYGLIRSADDFEKRIEATWKIQNTMGQQSEYYTKVKLFRGDKLPSAYYIYMDLARKFFANQCSTVGLEEESFIVFKNSGAAITRSTICESVENCFSEQIVYDEFSEDEVIEKIYEMDFFKTFIPVSGVAIKGSDKHDRYLTLLTGQTNDSAVVGTLFSENKLYELFNIPNLPENMFFYIKDTHDDILVSKNLTLRPFEVPEGTGEIEYNDTVYNVMQYTMNSIGYKVIMGIADSYFNEMLVPLKVLIIRYILIAIGIGILLSIIFTLYSYMPLKKLMDIPLLADRSRKKPQTNEYKYIRELMERSEDEIQKLRNNIRDMDNTLRVNLFVRLLHGNVNADDEMKLVMQLIPQLSSEYQVAIIKVDIFKDDESSVDYLSFLVYDQLSHLLPSDFLFGQLDRTKTAVLIPGTQQNVRIFTDAIRQINSKVSVHHITLAAGISELSTGIDKINTAFYHAQYSLFERNGDSICYYTTVPEIEELSLDLVGIQRLYELVQAGKSKEVEDMLEKISFALMNGGSYSCEDVRKTFYIVRFVLESVIKNMQCKAVVLPEYHKNETVQELFSALGNSASKIFLELEKRKQNANLELKKSVLNYINGNYADKSIYVTTIASVVGVSEGYVHKLVKECTGYSLNNYIRKLRAEKVAQMLKETDLPVCDISDICGFYVLRTFYREFKKHYGVTPSEFRENSYI